MISFNKLKDVNTRLFAAAVATFTLIGLACLYGMVNISTEYPCTLQCANNTPVCGINGFWYGNSCLAQCAQVKTTRHTEICRDSMKVKVEDVIAESTANRNEGYQFIGFLEFRNKEEEQVSSRFGFLRTDSNASQNSAIRYVRDVASAVNDKVASAVRQVGDYVYNDHSNLNDEMPGGWTIIEDDGAVYVRMDDSNEANDNSVGDASASTSATMEMFGNTQGCRSNSTPTPSSLNGSVRSINRGTNPFIRSFASLTPSEQRFGRSNTMEKAEGIEYVNESDKRNLAVIDDDTRWNVADATTAPHRQVGEMYPLGCTGTLIGPKHVITAAHCLWYRSSRMNGGGAFLASDWFYAGRTAIDKYSTSSKVRRKLIHRQYKSFSVNEFNWDFGVVELYDNIGYELGWLGIQTNCSDTQLDLHVAGYPSDKPRHSMWMAQCGKTPVGCAYRSISHTCDTAPGMSGSSMWALDPVDKEYKIRAVHVAGSSYVNRATYIDREVFSTINSWRGIVESSCPLNWFSKAVDSIDSTIEN